MKVNLMDNIQIKVSNILIFILILSLWAALFIMTQVLIDIENHKDRLAFQKIQHNIREYKMNSEKLPPPELDVPSITSGEFEVENVEVPGIPYGNR